MDRKKLRKISTAPSMLARHIDDYQNKNKFPDHWDIRIYNTRQDDGHFHPSSDCTLTPQELYLYKSGQLTPKPVTAALRRTFDCGTMWHGYIQNMLVDMGFVDEKNVERHHVKEISNEMGKATTAGTGDLIDVEIPGMGKWLVDIKTMGKSSFQSPPESLMEKYIAQVNIYSDYFDTDKMMILGVCKDNPHEFKEIIVQKDENLITDIYDKWIYVQYCLDNNIEPTE